MTSADLSSPHQLMLDVSGMTCGGCAASVQRLLTGVDGVSAASVDLAAKSAAVTVTKNVPVPELVAVLENAGFPARLREE
ncbi:heavy-metal-associated domain-containing protein [Pannonibacter sp. I15F10I1]|uniref:heavy-metal-associated domain-containing protein n=1 Tax=Pannonibacter sp. I15F10I1 TaxID=2003580 RepID=UPI001648A156|nr:heavy metal-associated domain-containing protein [Pannonibacter sp. I15F10I1]